MSVFFIIGGSSGIGKRIAAMLAESGHNVFATYNRHVCESSPTIQYHFLDVLEDAPDVHFLPETLDGVVYCPGSIRLMPFQRIKPPDFLTDYRINVEGAVKILQAVLPRLKNSHSPSVVLFSTVAASLGLPYHSLVSASKGAVEGLTRALAAEWAPAIRVNCIAPSLTDTPLAASLINTPEKKEANANRHPLKKIGQPDDIASMAEFLLSEKSGWVTGQVFRVDGGLSVIR